MSSEQHDGPVAANPGGMAPQTRPSLGWWLLAVGGWIPVAFLLLLGTLRAHALRVEGATTLLEQALAAHTHWIEALGRPAQQLALVWAEVRQQAGRDGPDVDRWRTLVAHELGRRGMKPRHFILLPPLPRASAPLDPIAAEWAPFIDRLIARDHLQLAAFKGTLPVDTGERIGIATLKVVRAWHRFYSIGGRFAQYQIAYGQLPTPTGPAPYLILIRDGDIAAPLLNTAWRTAIARQLAQVAPYATIAAAPLSPASVGEARPPTSRVMIIGQTRWQLTAALPPFIHLFGAIAALAWLSLSLAWLLGSYRTLVLGDTRATAGLGRRFAFHLLLSVGLPVWAVAIVGELAGNEETESVRSAALTGLHQELRGVEEYFELSRQRLEAAARRKVHQRPIVRTASEGLQWLSSHLGIGPVPGHVHLVSSTGVYLVPPHASQRFAHFWAAHCTMPVRKRYLQRIFSRGAAPGLFVENLLLTPPRYGDRPSAPEVRELFLGPLHRTGSPSILMDASLRNGLAMIGREYAAQQNKLLRDDTIPAEESAAVGISGFMGASEQEAFRRVFAEVDRLVAATSGNDRGMVMFAPIRNALGFVENLAILSWWPHDLSMAWMVQWIAANAGRPDQMRFFAVPLHPHGYPVTAATLPWGLTMTAEGMTLPGQSATFLTYFPEGGWHLVALQASRVLAPVVIGAAIPLEPLAAGSTWRRTQQHLLVAIVIIGLLALTALRRWLLTPIDDLQYAVAGLGRPGMALPAVRGAIGEFAALEQVFGHVQAGLEELDLARVVQEELLALGHHRFGTLSAFGRSQMMETVGGDHLDVLAHPHDNTVYFMVGDVSGHGLGASVVVAMAGAGLRTCLHLGIDSPPAMFENIGKHLFRILGRVKMMSALLIRIDRSTGEYVLTSAGHPPGLQFGDDTPTQSFSMPGFPLAASGRNKALPVRTGTLAPGEWFVGYTDGAIEADTLSGQPVGYEGWRDVVVAHRDRDLERHTARLFAALRDLTGTTAWNDDVSILVIRRQPTVPAEPLQRVFQAP